jgi:fibronectin type 3 domain-containing protein
VPRHCQVAASTTKAHSKAALLASSGLVAAYGFDEGSGSGVTDASGNGNNGTTASTTWASSGKYGKALQFNGTSSLVTIADAASLHLSSGMTLEAWVNPSTVNANWRDVIYKGNDNFYLSATSTNSSRPDAGMIAGGTYADAFGPAKLPANTWSYLTETYDGSTLRLYVNGTQVASTAHTGSIATSTNPLQIGGDSIYGQHFAGLIDEVRVYNTALTASQIQTDQASPVNPSGPDTTPPTQPGTLTATAVSGGEVDLSWGTSTDNVGVTGYQVERCQGAGCTNFSQIATPGGTSYKDTSVSASTTYTYRVRATDAAANLSSYSNIATTTTPTPDTSPPTQPGTLNANAISGGEVDLSWGASTDNVGVTGYRVERCQGAGCTNFTQIATPSGTSYKDTSVSGSNSYSYRVRATDAAGNFSPYSNTASATTPAGPSGLVAAYGFDEGSGSAVTDASGSANNGMTASTTWASSGKYGKALQFNGTSSLVTVADAASLHLSSGMTLEAWVNPSTVNGAWRDVIYKGNDNYYLSATSTNASLPDAGMIAGGTYADAFGTSVLPTNTWSFLTETYDGSTLRLYVNGTQVASTAHTGSIATSTNPLQIGGDSIYGQHFAGLIDEARIYNVALTAARIQTDMNTPVGIQDTTAPTQPGTLSANAVSASEVDLSWGASTDNVGVTGYKVERCSGTGCTNFAQIGTTTGTGTTYKDTTVSAPNSYSYRVRATDAAGNLSTYSNVATAATTIGPATKLAFIQRPTDTAVGATITPAVTVAVEDANGNVETSDNATQVSLAIGTNPASGSLSGGSAVTVASGVATFSGLSIDKAGTGYTLTASSTPSYTGATSAAFNITTGAPGWTTYLQGIDRTGFTSDSGFNPTSVKNLHLAWQASDTAPNNGIFPQPVVSNGLVYWGSNDGFERATSTAGNLVWQKNLGRTAPPGPCVPSDWGIASTPTITTDVPVGGASSVMYIGGGDSKLYALNAATGAVLWSYDVGGNPDTFLWDSPAVFGNSVYIGVASFGDCPLVQGQMLQINRVTGALQNTFNVVPNGCTGGGVWSSPTVDAAAGTIYFTTGTPSPDCPSTPGGPSMYELQASNLSLVGSWTVPANQQIDDSDFGGTPTLFNGVIGGQSVPLVGAINKDGIFYAFKRDAVSSGPVWQTRIATGGGDPTTGHGPDAPAAFDGTTLYVGGDNTSGCSGTVNALNPSTGAFIWKRCFTDGGFVDDAVTVTSGGVVVVGEGNNIQVVSAATGAILFTYNTAGAVWGPASVVGSTLYEGDIAGNLYALTTN